MQRVGKNTFDVQELPIINLFFLSEGLLVHCLFSFHLFLFLYWSGQKAVGGKDEC